MGETKANASNIYIYNICIYIIYNYINKLTNEPTTQLERADSTRCKYLQFRMP